MPEITDPATRPDLIDRAALREAVKQAIRDNEVEDIFGLIDAAPAAEPVPPGLREARPCALQLPLPDKCAVHSATWPLGTEHCIGVVERLVERAAAEPVPLTLDALAAAIKSARRGPPHAVWYFVDDNEHPADSPDFEDENWDTDEWFASRMLAALARPEPSVQEDRNHWRDMTPESAIGIRDAIDDE